jgi:hypothetical protein
MEFTKAQREEQAEKAMYNFNFEKVHEHMVNTNHKWVMGDDHRVPDIEDLRVQARSLLTKVIWNNSEVTNCGSGGFVAYKLPWGIQLTFQLAWA